MENRTEGAGATYRSGITAVSEYTLDEYQMDASRTMSNPVLNPQSLAIGGLGIAGEAGEVADYIKKVVGHGHELDREKLVSEVGDCLWYCAYLATLLDVPLSRIAEMNQEKLRKRYPNGFSSERSQNRSE